MSAAISDRAHLSKRSIINHDIMNCTVEDVVGKHLYSGRALGLSEPWDVIQLHPELEPLFPQIADHYRRVGLPFTEDVIWDIQRSHLGSRIGFEPDVFFFGPHENSYWGNGRWMEAVEYINSKNRFMQLARELGVDVPWTQCYDSPFDISDREIECFMYPCYLKAAVSESGAGIHRCTSPTELREALKSFSSATAVQVQEELIAETFLNLQYTVINGRPYRMAASEQILDGFSHQGNRVPVRYQPWQTVDIMADWLVKAGMRGIFAFDIAVVQTNNGLRFPAIECNPRYNGASYPTLIANKLGIRQWCSLTMNTRHRDIASIDLSGIEFDPKAGTGVIIINWGTVLAGSLMVLVAGQDDEQIVLTMALQERL